MTTHLSVDYNPFITRVYSTQASDTIDNIDDLISYLLPRIERLIEKRFYDLSYTWQQELISAAIIRVWERAKQEGPATHGIGFWINTAKFGAQDGLIALNHETGAFINSRTRVAGEPRIVKRILYASEVSVPSGDDPLEVIEAKTHRNPGPVDPEGGKVDQRLDFEQLATKAFTLIPRDVREDCREVAQHLALSDESGEAAFKAKGWSEHKYRQTVKHLKLAFHLAAGKPYTPREVRPTIDKQPILELHAQGYSQNQIAVRVGCSKGTVHNAIEALKKRQGKTTRYAVDIA